MSAVSYRRHLGPLPVWTGIAYWTFAVGLTVVAWKAGELFPRAGLVLIGLTPFANLYCFFRGLTAFSRTMTYGRTARTAKRLGLVPDWGLGSGGFLLVDEGQGLWAGNGQGGPLHELARLVCHTNGQAHYLEFWPHGAAQPLARVGLGSENELAATGRRLHALTAKHGVDVELASVDARS